MKLAQKGPRGAMGHVTGRIIEVLAQTAKFSDRMEGDKGMVSGHVLHVCVYKRAPFRSSSNEGSTNPQLL